MPLSSSLGRTSQKHSLKQQSNLSSPTKTHFIAPRISRWALQEIAEVCNDQVFTPEVQALSQLCRDDIVSVDELLGEGGFCSVYKVQIRTSSSSSNNNNNSNSNTTSALKQLRRSKRGRDEEDWVLAVYDLCNETSLLAKLSSLSPHIVQIQGVCHLPVSKAYQQAAHYDKSAPAPHGYFFVMEVLEETLSDRLNGWRRHIKQRMTTKSRLTRRFVRRCHSLGTPSSSNNSFDLTSDDLTSTQSMYERLQRIAVGIAQAMACLHSKLEHSIVLRDLKPQNIGFDTTGTVKLFDFGMARPVHETDTAELAGTFRYLAPEAILGRRIGVESDVYSFGIILYELVTLQKAFESYFSNGKLIRKEAFVDHVVVGGWRPSLSHVSCRATRRLIAKCWDPSPRARPNFDRIYFLLNQILNSHYYQQGEASSSSVIDNESTVVVNEGMDPPAAPATSPFRTPTAISRKGLHREQQESESENISPLPPQKPSSAASLPSLHKAPSFRVGGLKSMFRHLKPLPKECRRMCSDITAETTTSNSVVGDS